MMREMDVNAIAGTLKLYFRELPEPLFTDRLYPNFTGGIGGCARLLSLVQLQPVFSDLWLRPQLCRTAWRGKAACCTC